MQKTTYGFDRSGNIPFVALHTFETTKDGQLAHYIDGNLRATVPPEGWADYCKEYPDAQDVVDSLIIKPQAPQDSQEEVSPAATGSDQPEQ